MTLPQTRHATATAELRNSDTGEKASGLTEDLTCAAGLRPTFLRLLFWPRVYALARDALSRHQRLGCGRHQFNFCPEPSISLVGSGG